MHVVLSDEGHLHAGAAGGRLSLLPREELASRNSWLSPGTCLVCVASYLRKAGLTLNLPNRDEGAFICIAEGLFVSLNNQPCYFPLKGF